MSSKFEHWRCVNLFPLTINSFRDSSLIWSNLLFPRQTLSKFSKNSLFQEPLSNKTAQHSDATSSSPNAFTCPPLTSCRVCKVYPSPRAIQTSLQWVHSTAPALPEYSEPKRTDTKAQCWDCLRSWKKMKFAMSVNMLQLLKVMKKGLKRNLIPKLKKGLIIKRISFWPQKHLLITEYQFIILKNGQIVLLFQRSTAQTN